MQTRDIANTKMAGRTPARDSSWQDKFPLSPLGATPRPHLRQVYPKPPEGSHEFELNQHSIKKTTVLHSHSQRSGLDTVDTVEVTDYNPLSEDYLPGSLDVGSSTKCVLILGFIFVLSLVAVGLVYVGMGPKSQG